MQERLKSQLVLQKWLLIYYVMESFFMCVVLSSF